MKILIAYDGSPCADAAVHDLRRAGLPSEADCIVLTMADVFPPPPPETSLMEDEIAKSMLAAAAARADQAARAVQSDFPRWSVRSEASPESPAWGVLKRATEWPADMVVMGSHGMSATDRLFIGSVSQRVMVQARCSVRVARGRPDADGVPVRLIIGFDGSTDAEAAIRAVASRSWPKDAEARLITAVDHGIVSAIAAKVLKPRRKPGEKDDYRAWLSNMAEDAADQLRKAGLKTTCSIAEGEPKRILIETAMQWRADCVFLGATGLRGLGRLLLGSVSSAVTAHAPCTVEVVRSR